MQLLIQHPLEEKKKKKTMIDASFNDWNVIHLGLIITNVIAQFHDGFDLDKLVYVSH